MRNKNRLIDDFKYQTATTIWKHLDAMAANYVVYSTYLKGLSPFLKDYDVYLYCNDTNIVIMCLDCCGHSEEQTYEESDTLSPLILTNGEEPRTSVIWKLAEAVRFAKTCLKEKAHDIKIYGLLLTEANILNAYNLYELWDKHNITVIDDLKRLKYKAIRVNNDSDLTCKTYIDFLIDTSFNEVNFDEPATLEPRKEDQCEAAVSDDKYEEFEKMLNDFINHEYEETYGKDPEEQQGIDTDNSEEECGTEAENEDVSITDEVLFPDGVIEQNNNISVKVEILRPIPNPRDELDRLVGVCRHQATNG